MSATTNGGSNECDNCGETSNRLINNLCPDCQGGRFRGEF